MRVGIISLQHESNAFLRAKTTLDDFANGILATGDDILHHYGEAHHEVGGCLEGVARAGFTAVPIFCAWATPGGIVSAETYEALVAQLVTELLFAAGPLDGLLVAPHGAGVSENHPDMDGQWLAHVRRVVGPSLPIICTIDPHANLSQRMVDACDAIIAYRTNPHVDQRERGLEAAGLLSRVLRGQVKPTMAAAFPALAIDMASQFTSAPPCVALYDLAAAQRANPNVLTNSIVLGFPYADVPEMGTSFVVVTDNDPAAAQALVKQLSNYAHDHRDSFVARLPGVTEAITNALQLEGPVCLLDVGDNVGGGSPGDGTVIAAELLKRTGVRSFVCLFDPEAVDVLKDSVGQTVRLRVGGTSDALHGSPLDVEVRVTGLFDGHFVETQPRHGGKTEYDMGPTAVVETDAGLTLMLTSRRTPPFSLNQLLSCGIDPSRYQIIVAKGVNAPVEAYRAACKHFIRVNTPGVTTNDMRLLPYRFRRKPMFPFE